MEGGSRDQVGIDLVAADGSGVDMMRFAIMSGCRVSLAPLSPSLFLLLPRACSCALRVLRLCPAPWGLGWSEGAGSVLVCFRPQGFIGPARALEGFPP